jgi:pre-mRNA-splicing factor SYF1
MERYGGSKMERLRDLFEQAIAKASQEDVAEFYIKYSKAEESFGLARHAMAANTVSCNFIMKSIIFIFE